MNKRFLLVFMVASVVPSAACTTGVGDSDAPEIDDTELEPSWARPQETTNGWKVSVGGGSSGSNLTGYVTFTKVASNDTTRGGGACIVGQNPASYVNCNANDDTPCINYAQSLLGPTAWGYCMPIASTTGSNPPSGTGNNGTCWIKPYSTTNCKLGPSQTSGTTLQPTLSTVGLPMTQYAILGCLSKSAGPTAACSQPLSGQTLFGQPLTTYVRAFATLD